MIETGNVAVHVHEGYALDVGTIERYLQANDDVLNGRVGTIVSPGEVLPLATGDARTWAPMLTRPPQLWARGRSFYEGRRCRPVPWCALRSCGRTSVFLRMLV